MSYDDDDDWDDDIGAVKRAVSKAGKKTVAELEKLTAAANQGLQNDERMLTAFNRMTAAIEGLTGEIRSLREDLSPSLEKPKKLPAPAGG